MYLQGYASITYFLKAATLRNVVAFVLCVHTTHLLKKPFKCIVFCK